VPAGSSVGDQVGSEGGQRVLIVARRVPSGDHTTAGTVSVWSVRPTGTAAAIDCPCVVRVSRGRDPDQE
jgi:hypothetical protein